MHKTGRSPRRAQLPEDWNYLAPTTTEAGLVLIYTKIHFSAQLRISSVIRFLDAPRFKEVSPVPREMQQKTEETRIAGEDPGLWLVRAQQSFDPRGRP